MFALVVGAMLAIHLVMAGAVHLTEDEAYYRLWSFTPAFGYYDHPPMIAWWIWAGRAIAGDNALGVRLMAAFGCALTTIIVFDLARLAGAGQAVARLAAIFYSATILIAAGGFLAVPDGPTSLFWATSLWCALKARRSGAGGWWLAAGLAAGLAALSKYSALFLPPGLALWLLSSREGRRDLLRAGPWTGALVALLVFAANIAWNASHHWLTFAKQFGRVGAGHFAPIHLPQFLIGQALLLNPLIAVLAGRALTQRRACARGIPNLAPFVLTSLPFAAYLVFHSLHDRVQAHWPVPLYASAAICAAAGAARTRGGWRRLAWSAPVFGFAVCAAAFAWLVIPAADLSPPFDPALAIRDWKPFAAGVDRIRRAAGAAWVGTASYGLAGELADETALAAPVTELFERARYRGLALGPEPDWSRPGLVVDLRRRIDLALLRRCFIAVQPLGVLQRGDAGGPFTAYAVVRVRGARRDIRELGCGDPL